MGQLNNKKREPKAKARKTGQKIRQVRMKIARFKRNAEAGKARKNGNWSTEKMEKYLNDLRAMKP